MGEACSMYGEEMRTGFKLGDQRERDQLQDRGADETIILKWIFKNSEEVHELDWSGSG